MMFHYEHQADTYSLQMLGDLAPALCKMTSAMLVSSRDGDL